MPDTDPTREAIWELQTAVRRELGQLAREEISLWEGSRSTPSDVHRERVRRLELLAYDLQILSSLPTWQLQRSFDNVRDFHGAPKI